MSEGLLKLRLFSQSTFPAPVASDLLASSPSLDLTATVTDANTVAIRRAGGELVSSSSEKQRVVHALCWKTDGQFLAVAWNDGTAGLLGVETTKVVHRINVAQRACAVAGAPPAPVTHMAWARNLTGKRHFGPAADSNSDALDQLRGEVDGDNGGAISDLVDLPHALTFLEIDTSLPKISPLPVSGGAGDDMFVFSTTASLESMFPPLRPEDNDVVDIMVAGMSDGTVHLSIYGSFPIGIFNVPTKLGPSPTPSQKRGGNSELCLHASHPEVSTHALLMRPGGGGEEDKAKALYLVPMDLRFVSHSPLNLSLLASKTTTLQKLLRYIKQTQIHVGNEWQSTRELPTRFLRFIQEDLGKVESGPQNIVQALYHTVLTGHVYRPVREWLVESIGDRGHKRWEKAVIPGLESVRNLIHENMLPALERSTLILSRLSGIARFHDQDDHIGFTNTDITRLVEIVAALTLICHRILVIVIEELDLFRMFSSWLRITIDRVSVSSLSDEIMEKEALLDPAKILRYIEKFLVQSPMATYFDELPSELVEEEWDTYMDDSTGMLDQVDQQARAQDAGEAEFKAMPQMGFLVDLLSEKAGDIFDQIAEAERRLVRFGQAVALELPDPVSKVAMTMCSAHKPSGMDGVIYTAVVYEDKPHILGIFETKVEIINGVSSAPTTTYNSTSLLDLGGGASSTTARVVIDLKFLDDKSLLLLCQAADGSAPPHLVCTPFRRSAAAACDAVTEEVGGRAGQELAFPEDLTAFAPVQMEVLGASDVRGEVPARVSLLGRDRVGCKVFALSGVAQSAAV